MSAIRTFPYWANSSVFAILPASNKIGFLIRNFFHNKLIALLDNLFLFPSTGEELVAFRTEDGVANVTDAYCPHLGAHLGIMGRVVGDCIECPFHGWRFKGKDGSCSHVPYAAKGALDT